MIIPIQIQHVIMRVIPVPLPSSHPQKASLCFYSLVPSSICLSLSASYYLLYYNASIIAS